MYFFWTILYILSWIPLGAIGGFLFNKLRYSRTDDDDYKILEDIILAVISSVVASSLYSYVGPLLGLYTQTAPDFNFNIIFVSIVGSWILPAIVRQEFGSPYD